MRRKKKIFSNEFILQTYTVEKFRFTFTLRFTFCKNRNDSSASTFNLAAYWRMLTVKWGLEVPIYKFPTAHDMATKQANNNLFLFCSKAEYLRSNISEKTGVNTLYNWSNCSFSNTLGITDKTLIGR